VPKKEEANQSIMVAIVHKDAMTINFES